MADLNLLPTTLNIDCVAGDDVSLEITVKSGGCSSTITDISAMTFSAEFTANNTIYSATITKDVANSKVTAIWSDTQTLAAGPGSWKWWLKVTEGAITRTRLSGSFREVARG